MRSELLVPKLDEPAINGHCDPRYLRLRQEFDENLRSRGELGAAVCLIVDGRSVVDLWGGFEDAARTRPWQRDTRVNVFSVGKGLIAISLGLLVQHYGLDLDAPVSRYWPEFAAAGKHEISVRTLAAHRAGLAGLRLSLPQRAMFDWQRMTSALAEESPWWTPGEAHGYHVNTYGFLIGELVRRISGSSIGALFRERVASPLAAAIGFGADTAGAYPVADCQLPSGPISFPSEDPSHRDLLHAAYSNPPGISGNGTVNSVAWRSAELPSANAHATARAIATVYASLLGSGSHGTDPMLSSEVLNELTSEHANGVDRVLRRPSRFGLGFQLTAPERPLGPNARGFGHFGAGGSLGFADPDCRLAFGYAINQPGPRWQNPRTMALVEAVYSGLSE